MLFSLRQKKIVTAVDRSAGFDFNRSGKKKLAVDRF